jgi:hypothetical protein
MDTFVPIELGVLPLVLIAGVVVGVIAAIAFRRR